MRGTIADGDRSAKLTTARSLRFLIVPALALFAGACATASPDCDPTTGGLIGAIHCQRTDGYTTRIENRQTRVTELMAEGAELARAQSELNAQLADSNSRLASAKADRARAERDLASVRAQIAAGEGNNRDLQRKATELQGKVDTSATDIADIGAERREREARLEKLARKEKWLQEEMRAAADGG